MMVLQGGRTRAAERRKVLIRARLRAGNARLEVCIRDISPRGMLLQAAAPPRRGTFVEVSVGGFSIVGRVQWTKERRFGITTRDTIPVGTLAGDPDAPPAPRKRARRARLGGSEGSRHAGQMLQFDAVAALCIGAGAGLAWGVHGFLADVERSVTAGLGGG